VKAGDARAEAVRSALGRALGEDLPALALRPAGGGCINQAALVAVGARTWFVKWNERPLPGQFAAEAAGLDALRESGTSLVVPAALAHQDYGQGPAFLVLEHLPTGARIDGFDEALGRGLAQLHQATCERFGFEVEGFCGATPQPNGWLGGWVEFYRERRLGHQLRLARARGLGADGCRALERLLERLETLLGDDEPPALIHGDLWSGNCHVAPDGRPGLIDPAAYYGHREAEIGMMELFGGFGARVYAAYQEVWPLRDGWRDRVPLYSLYHVLNHYNLFGGGYGAQAVQIARRYVG
jgi:fructosamine-3-kinase